ncbi:MAG: hypothetical protein HY344_00950 [Candidatus Levybacteria bacterium]|nr:hypothetical protein [Candidatus Levybacteria bacterium]
MLKTEIEQSILIPESFRPPSPTIALFMVDLVSYVERNRIYQQDPRNPASVSVRTADSNPLFFHAFYYRRPRLYLDRVDKTYLLGGVDRKEGVSLVNGQSHDLYRSYELVYSPQEGFNVMAIQTAIPNPYEGEGAIVLWRSKMSKKGIQRLSRKIQRDT